VVQYNNGPDLLFPESEEISGGFARVMPRGDQAAMPRRFLLPILLLLLSPAAFAATISGTVTAAGTGQALGGMAVAAYTPAGVLQATVTTDSQGRYTITLPAGDTRLLAYDLSGSYATSYYSNAASFETAHTFKLSASQNVTGINFSMIKGGRINGTVVSAATGVALPGMTVAAYTLGGINRERVTTDSDGNFFLLLPPGDYVLATWDEQYRYVTEFYHEASKAAQATPVRIGSGEVRSGHRFTLELGAKVSGTVRDQWNWAPLPGITVSAYRSTGELLVQSVTNASGQFTMAVPAGTARFVAHDDAAVYAGGFHDRAETFATAREIQLSSGQTVGGIDFALDKGGWISGRVSSLTSGAPIPGIGITVYTSSGAERTVTYTDGEGNYSVFLAPGYYRIAAWDAQGSFAPQFWSNKLTLTLADAVLVSSQQTTATNFTLSAAARVSGSVFSSAGHPLSGIAVAALDASGATVASALTAGNGAYSLSLPSGTYTLMATDPNGRYPSSVDPSPHTLSAGQILSSVNFELLAPPGRRRPAIRRTSPSGKTAAEAMKGAE
jgi:hypothetical protein